MNFQTNNGVSQDEVLWLTPQHLRTFLGRRLRLMIVVVMVITIGTALVTWRLTPIYEASASVEVLPASSTSGAQSILENLVDPRSALQTQVELIKSTAVLSRAANELGISDYKLLERALSVQLVQETQIVQISIENASREEAADYANAVANTYLDFRRNRAQETSLAASEAITRQINEIRGRVSAIEATGQADVPGTTEKTERDRLVAQLGALEGQLLVLPDAEALRRGGGTIISKAEPPEDPVRPRPILNIALALFTGLALAVGAALVAEVLDDRIRKPEDVEASIGVPVLGHIPIVDSWADKAVPLLATESATSSSAAEAYRTLRTNLRFVSLDSPIKTVLITSPTAGAGKTTTATNLAAVFAGGGSKAILVAGDLRKPAAHRVLGLKNTVGIAQGLDGDIPLHKLLQRHEGTNLRLLAAGGTPPNPTEVLASGRFGEMLTQLSKASDVVIVDSPPVLGLGDVSALASRVDGILLVINAASVTRKALTDAADQIRKAGGKIIGVVMNAVDAKDGYGYYYQNYYADYVKDSEPSSNGVAAIDPGADIFGDLRDDENTSEMIDEVDPTGPSEETR